jgi:hypothetical protein
VIALILLAAIPQDSAAQVRIVSRFGEANVGNERVLVHVTVAVPPGLDANAAAENALRGQGARPFQGDEFSTTGLVWDQFSDANSGNDKVIQNYNPANEPTGAALNALTHTHHTWTDVSTSGFVLTGAGAGGAPAITNRCPSLVKECKGPQKFDGNNDVAWLPIAGCCTLAVTWSSSTTDEADMAINTNFSWETDGVHDYDLESVILHENGHVAGLGHSEIAQAVMYAYYSAPLRELHADDIQGITFLYPGSGTTGTISGNVQGSDTLAPLSGATVSVGALSATTNGAGDYTISQVPEGVGYVVTAQAAGYSDETVSGVAVTAGSDTSGVNFSLDPDLSALVISGVSAQKSGNGGAFKINWTTNKPANSEVTFTCCGTYTDSALVTSHSMSFRGTRGATYIYTVKSTDASGSTAEAGPFQHVN